MIEAGALGLAAGLYALGLSSLRTRDRAFPSTDPALSPWWFGYARDGINLLGFAGFFIGFLVLRLPGAHAALAAALLTLAAYAIDYLIGRVLGPARSGLVVGVALVVLAAVAAWQSAIVEQSLAAVEEVLF